jgi:predicted transcriptional regulator
MTGQPGPPQSRHGAHNGVQTAFRLPPELKAWLESHAMTTGRTMTDIVITALENERDRAATPAG